MLTWLLYFVLTIYRSTANWRGRRAAWLGVVGFALVLCTFLAPRFSAGITFSDERIFTQGSDARNYGHLRIRALRENQLTTHTRCPFFSSESITKQLR